METTDESGGDPVPGPAAITAQTVEPRRPDGLPVGRPWQPGQPSANPTGRPRDPFAALIREGTKDGVELVEFALACLRDDLDGRIADKSGLCDRMDLDAAAAEEMAAKARDAGDVFGTATHETRARELRAKAKAMRTKLARKRKIPVPVKSRIAALEYLSNRGWGKPRETIDLSLGNPDGSPLGANPAMPAPGALSSLTVGDLAEIGAVLERATKRGEPIEAEPSTVDPTSSATG